MDFYLSVYRVHLNAPWHYCQRMLMGTSTQNRQQTSASSECASIANCFLWWLIWLQTSSHLCGTKSPWAPRAKWKNLPEFGARCVLMADPECRSSSHLSQTLKVPVGNRYCQQFWSSSELKTRSLCFSEVMCCCHCFSLLQFLPHSQQWLPACVQNKAISFT